MEKKIIYYSDPLNDDFALKSQNGYTTPTKFKYHKGLLFRLFANIIYYLIAIPVVWFIAHLVHHIRIYGKKNLKGLKKGCFMYSNHTTTLDPFFAALISAPRRSYCIANPVISRYLGMRNIIRIVGGLPLPSTVNQTKDFLRLQKKIIKARDNIIIYPEAHIWEYYNGIRPFLSTSFKYPVILDAPVVALTTVFRTPKKEGKRPYVSVYVSKPFWPNKLLNGKDIAKDLRDKAYDFMVNTAKEHNSYEYIKYVYKPKDENIK